MKIILNGQEYPGPVTETRLGPLVERLQKEQQDRGLYLLQIRLDGEDLPGLAKDFLEKPLDQTHEIELRFAPMEALIERNLDNAGLYLDRLLPGIDQAAQLFRTGNEQEANQFFLRIVDGIDWFSEVIDSIVQAKNWDPAQVQLGTQSLLDRKNRLLALTGQMLEANQNRDWVLLADLLEYEVLPFYEQWKTLLPHLQNPPESTS